MNNANGNLVRQVFERARFVRSLGIELISFGDGWCETRIGVVPAHEQQHGLVHAGVLITLADHTCGGAAATTAPDGREPITETRFHSCGLQLDRYSYVAVRCCDPAGTSPLLKPKY